MRGVHGFSPHQPATCRRLWSQAGGSGKMARNMNGEAGRQGEARWWDGCAGISDTDGHDTSIRAPPTGLSPSSLRHPVSFAGTKQSFFYYMKLVGQSHVGAGRTGTGSHTFLVYSSFLLPTTLPLFFHLFITASVCAELCGEQREARGGGIPEGFQLPHEAAFDGASCRPSYWGPQPRLDPLRQD